MVSQIGLIALSLAAPVLGEQHSWENASQQANDLAVRARIVGRPAWTIVRDASKRQAKAIAGPGATVRGLAGQVGLDADDERSWHVWLTPTEGPANWSNKALIPLSDGRLKDLNKTENGLLVDDEIEPGVTVWVPNTVLALWYGDLGSLGKKIVGWQDDLDFLSAQGFKVETREQEKGDEFQNFLGKLAIGGALHGIFITGHGSHSSKNGGVITNSQGVGFWTDLIDITLKYNYRLALVIVNTCDGQKLAASWASENGHLLAVDGILVPPFDTKSPRNGKDYVGSKPITIK